MSASDVGSGLKVISPDDIPALDIDPVDPSALKQAREIVDDIKANGIGALQRWAVHLGDLKQAEDQYVLSKAEMELAYTSLPKDQQELLQRTTERVRQFADSQRQSLQSLTTDIPGGKAGHTVSPVTTAGCYAPGGRYPLPSSVIMTAVTARSAGVKTVVVASPRPSPVTVAAAHVSGADVFLKIGGAQGVAAMAFGVGEGIPACDVIVGPGNKWVTAAKSLVQGRCSIDMLAGPSEVLVIADSSADPDTLAADLLAQAEHDVEARAILVTPDRGLIDSVNRRLVARLAELPTRATAVEAVKNGFAVLCPDMDTAIAVSDKIAPEHLEVQTQDAQAVADRCLHYGGLFIGEHAAEVLGDYGAGPNHTLPTAGTAKYTGGLSVFNFLRIRTWMRIDDRQASQGLVRDSIQLARLEGLEGHAQSAECRLLGDDGTVVKKVKMANGH